MPNSYRLTTPWWQNDYRATSQLQTEVGRPHRHAKQLQREARGLKGYANHLQCPDGKKKKNKLEKRRDNCRGTNQLHSMLRRLQNIYRQRQGDTKHYRVERQTNNYRGRKRRGDFRVKINNWRETERVSLCLFQFANLWLRIEKWFLFSEKSKESLAFTARL